jgi:plastocyanin
MPSISSRASIERGGARAAILVGSIILAATLVLGLWSAMAAEAGVVHTVVMEEMRFSPGTVRVKPGDRVIFRNRDLVPHTATSKGEKLFDSGAIKPGESWTFSPPPRRAIRYACTFHPMMEGEIDGEQP